MINLSSMKLRTKRRIKIRKTRVRYDALSFALLLFFQSSMPLFSMSRYHKPIHKSPTFSYYSLIPNKNLENPEKIEKKGYPKPSVAKNMPPKKLKWINTSAYKKTLTNKQPSVKKTVLYRSAGPTQPEAQSFSPSGNGVKVDPFTGNLSYSIPILNVDGYPITLSYGAGIGMQQEATWVGLGWSLNPGVINRSMRGIPDDFDGDEITKNYNRADNVTVGVGTGINLEAFGIEAIGLGATTGLTYNNYSGFSSSFSFGPSFNIENTLGLNIQLSGDSQAGPTIGANASLSFSDKESKTSTSLGIGTSYSSRRGFQNISINMSMSAEGKDKKGRNKSISSNPIGGSFNLGMQTYVPSIPYETKDFSFTGKFKLGGDIWGVDGSFTFRGFMSRSHLTNNTKSLQSYGYMYLQDGQKDNKAMLDFNRENDGSFTKNTPALPIPHLTYDLFSVSGVGVSGSYRMDRRDIGYVFDPMIKNISNSASLGGEFAAGGLVKVGVDIGVTHSKAKAGVWVSGNSSVNRIGYNQSRNYFRNASDLSFDKSNNDFQNIGGADPAYFKLLNASRLSGQLATSSGTKTIENEKSRYFQRNQPLTFITVNQVKDGFSPTKFPSSAYALQDGQGDHHIGAFTVTKKDGSRYEYGLPAYNIVQKNVSFAVGNSTKHNGGLADFSPDWDTKLINYGGTNANSISNKYGVDHYYNEKIMPAYSTAFMLTSVLGPNYVDSDNKKGPSKEDLGSYIQFKYKHISNYKWRNPIGEKKASFTTGLNANPQDDRGNYIYGVKELWYLDTIQTKTHIVRFYTSNRNDAVSVSGEDGGLSSGPRMQKLDSIKLFSRPEFEQAGDNAVPVKAVYFKYDYTLCHDYPGNINGGGKLTLKEVYFTYKESYKGERTPYTFSYGEWTDPNGNNVVVNPNYNLHNIDRWGTFKKNPTGLTGNEYLDPLTNSEYPYTGTDRVNANKWASAWNLSTIHQPTGEMIKISYEADDYAYVQHKRATQMFKIIGVGDNNGEIDSSRRCSISNLIHPNRRLYFKLLPGTTYKNYGEKGDMIYFKALVNVKPLLHPNQQEKDADKFDYVPGWAKIKDIGVENGYGWVELEPARLNDNGLKIYNPMSVTAIQFARNYLARYIPPSSQSAPGTGLAFLNIAKAIVGAFTSYRELFLGPNKPLWDAPNEMGKFIITDKSWLRLTNPDFKKLGGGYRVSTVFTYDNWKEMTSSVGDESAYGKKYIYHFDGKSSGVASYEPQIGGDENVWKMPVANNTKMLLAPDIRNYMLTPFGEQVFPTPSVGYSKVKIEDISINQSVSPANGYTVDEFYTAREFPTITAKTAVKTAEYKSNRNGLIYSTKDNRMAASQGFVVENNNMHGKPKTIQKFAEGQDAPYSFVKYYYKNENKIIDGIAAHHLTNKVKVITPSGTIKDAIVGRTYEAVADFRNKTSGVNGGKLGINLNTLLLIVPVPVPMALPANISHGENHFNSSVFSKTIERQGILYKTVAVKNGSKIVTENLAYDAKTGEVLLTSVNNAYSDTSVQGDKVYNFTYPAHWIYKGMGQAAANLGYYKGGTFSFNAGDCGALSNQHFFEGDMVILGSGSSYVRGWVTKAEPNKVHIIFKDGSPVSGTYHSIKVLRSGHRNLQVTPVGTVTLKSNPLNTLTGNIFQNVLNAKSIKYGSAWQTFCDCNVNIRNPYTSGRKGNWHPKATYLYLSNRTQSFENKNTNIRKDGVMESFMPFFRLENGQWKINMENWTTTSKVTQFSPQGQILEAKDPLNRFSSTLLGYKQTLQEAAAKNAKRTEIGFDGFEDYDFNSCPDGHFHIDDGTHLTTQEFHSGLRSLKVQAGDLVVFHRQIAACEVKDPCDFSSNLVTEINQTTGESEAFIFINNEVTMHYENIYGNPVPSYTQKSNGVELGFSGNGENNHFKVNVTLTNNEGCTKTFIVTEDGVIN